MGNVEAEVQVEGKVQAEGGQMQEAWLWNAVSL